MLFGRGIEGRVSGVTGGRKEKEKGERGKGKGERGRDLLLSPFSFLPNIVSCPPT
jgi:hypothetical protein